MKRIDYNILIVTNFDPASKKHTMFKYSYVYTFVFFLFIISCENKKKNDKETKPVEPLSVDSTNNIKIKTNEAANIFYATLGGLNESISTDSSNSENTTLSEQWGLMRQRLLDPISDWKKQSLPDECKNTGFLFYPFSGPDFIISNEIFSGMNRMIMFGLEEPGKDISYLGKDYAATMMPQMKVKLRDYFGKSYFITGNMMKDFKSDSVRGVAPLLCTFIVRSGYSIISVNNFYIDSTGNKNYAIASVADNGNIVKGVEIKYSKDQKTESSIDYLSFRAENESIDKHPELKTYFETNIPEQTCTYVKSASYLMHYNAFSYIRDLCLKKSKYILQDDTGIPYQQFVKGWNFKIWGVYEKPIRDFSGVFQSDLDAYYKADTTVQPLPFNMGYHYNNSKQNLMLATKL